MKNYNLIINPKWQWNITANVVMRKLCICFILFVSLISYAQTKVAVYVVPSDNLNETTSQIIGSELVAGIVKNNDYIAVERTKEFLAAIQEEQQNSSVQTIDDDKIRSIGRQMGVSLICVANVIPYQNSYYIQARMLSVEFATIEATARETSALSSLDEIVTAAESLTTKLMIQVKEKKEERVVAAEQERQRQQLIAAQRAREEEIRRQQQIAEQNAANEQFRESLDDLGNSIISLVQTIYSYSLVINNTKNYPCKIILDGKDLGIINPFKTITFQLPIESYGKLQAVQTKGYLFYPTVYNYKIPKQQKSARVVVNIK